MSAAPYRVRSYNPSVNLTRRLAYGTLEAALRDAAELVYLGNEVEVGCVGDDGVERPVPLTPLGGGQ